MKGQEKKEFPRSTSIFAGSGWKIGLMSRSRMERILRRVVLEVRLEAESKAIPVHPGLHGASLGAAVDHLPGARAPRGALRVIVSPHPHSAHAACRYVPRMLSGGAPRRYGAGVRLDHRASPAVHQHI